MGFREGLAGGPPVSSPGSFPSKVGICILTGFPISFSASGTRKRGGGTPAGQLRRLIPSSASVLELLSQNHVQDLPPAPPHQPVGTSQLSCGAGQGAEAPGGAGSCPGPQPGRGTPSRAAAMGTEEASCRTQGSSYSFYRWGHGGLIHKGASRDGGENFPDKTQLVGETSGSLCVALPRSQIEKEAWRAGYTLEASLARLGLPGKHRIQALANRAPT